MSPEIEENDILEGPFWDEPVEVLTVDSRGSGVEIHAKGMESRETFPQTLSEEDLQMINVQQKGEGPSFTGDPDEFHQAIEAARIDLAAEYNSQYAVTTSQVDPVPHQLEAVYGYMLPENFPDNQIKFFLADDAGAGKTIMAGLLFKELKQRGIVENCLILTPAKLRRQWQNELLRLLEEEFRIIKRPDIEGVGNPWQDNKFCITSMAFAIQDDVKESLEDVDWDLVICDEAHHLSAYRYGADEDEEKTERYKLAENLRDNSRHRLFLSATPHKGRRDHFQLLLRLLDEDLFAEDQLQPEVIRSDEPGTVFLRRMKEAMIDLDGQELFEERNVHTVSYEIAGEELEFYKAVTDYVENQFQAAWKKDNRHVQFALIILQRRVASSITAARRSLERRKEGLEDLREDIDKLREKQKEAEAALPDQETLEEMAERQRWEIEEDALRRLTMSANREELQNEIETVQRLIRKAEDLEAKETERKLEELQQLLREDTPFGQDEKIVIFTEAKDTLDFLVDKIDTWGYDYVTIHGQKAMGQAKNPREGTRLWAQDQFNDPDGPQVLVATDAAGEGINLHRECRLMINYDIPWNPTRLEQRMGRIHRYGQQDPVHIYNLVASNTREGHVLETLLEKLEQMREDIGSDHVFDVISELAEEVSLDGLIRDVVSGARETDVVDRQIDALDETAERAVERATQRGLATSHIDLTKVREWQRESKVRRLTPEYIEKFFVHAFELFDTGQLEKRQDGFWRIEWVPATLRRLAEHHQFRTPAQQYTKFTFYKEEADRTGDAEFVSPGHPLFEAVAQKAADEFSPTLTDGAVFVDPDADTGYLLWFIRQVLQDGNRETVGERVFCVRYDQENGFERVHEGILHDLKPVDEDGEVAESRIEDVEAFYDKTEDAKDWFYDNVATEYRAEIEEEKQEVVNTIRPSMKKALNSAIFDLREEIHDMEEEEAEGKDMERAIENKERKRENLIERRDAQKERLERAEHVIPADTVILGAAAVLPPTTEGQREEYGGMARDEEVEEVAMQETMAYERDQGREPEDVAEENLGFDVRSQKTDGEGRVQEARYIEVKGRAGEGAVSITENEWTMADRLGEEFWLYIVTNAKDDPQLHRIKNPAAKLEPDERVRYFVNRTEWTSSTEEKK